MIKKLKVYLRPVELSRFIKNLKFFIIFINGGILSLTDSHHNHHGQNPTMVGICHGGNVPVSHDQHRSMRLIASLASQTHCLIELTEPEVNYIISIVLITKMIVSRSILDQLMDLSGSHCG